MIGRPLARDPAPKIITVYWGIVAGSWQLQETRLTEFSTHQLEGLGLVIVRAACAEAESAAKRVAAANFIVDA